MLEDAMHLFVDSAACWCILDWWLLFLPHVNSSVREDATVAAIHLLDCLFCAGERCIDSSCALKVSFMALLGIESNPKRETKVFGADLRACVSSSSHIIQHICCFLLGMWCQGMLTYLLMWVVWYLSMIQILYYILSFDVHFRNRS